MDRFDLFTGLPGSSLHVLDASGITRGNKFGSGLRRLTALRRGNVRGQMPVFQRKHTTETASFLTPVHFIKIDSFDSFQYFTRFFPHTEFSKQVTRIMVRDSVVEHGSE